MSVYEKESRSLFVICEFEDLKESITKYMKMGWNFIRMHPTFVANLPSSVTLNFVRDK